MRATKTIAPRQQSLTDILENFPEELIALNQWEDQVPIGCAVMALNPACLRILLTGSAEPLPANSFPLEPTTSLNAAGATPHSWR